MMRPRTRATIAVFAFSAAIALAGCAATPADRLTMPRAAPDAMRAQADEFCGEGAQAELSGWVQRSHHGGRRVYALYTIWTCTRDEPG